MMLTALVLASSAMVPRLTSLRVPRAPLPRIRAPCAASAISDDAVSELLELTAAEYKDKERILQVFERLEAGPTRQYLSDPQLLGNYELGYFDRSVDGNRDGRKPSGKNDRPPSLLARVRRKALGLLFKQRGTYQHVPSKDELVNFVQFRFLGIPGSVVARGQCTQLEPAEIAEIAASNGTALTDQTARIVFDAPRVAFGAVCFELSGPQAQPPVDLCTTYLDERVRLATASRGGRFVFQRSPKADSETAAEWREILDRSPTDPRFFIFGAVAVTSVGLFRPMLLAQTAYAALGIGLGFGGTKLMKFTLGGGLHARARIGNVAGRLQSKLRAFVLRIDPSLEDSEGDSLGWRDLRGPRWGKPKRA